MPTSTSRSTGKTDVVPCGEAQKGAGGRRLPYGLGVSFRALLLTAVLLVLSLAAVPAGAEESPGVVVMTGRLVDSEGRAMSGRVRPEPETPVQAEQAAWTEVAADGRFSVAVPAGHRLEIETLSTLFRWRRDEQAAGAAVEVGDVIVPDTRSVRIVVTAPGGVTPPSESRIWGRLALPGGFEWFVNTALVDGVSTVRVPDAPAMPEMVAWADVAGTHWQGELLAGTPIIADEVQVRMVVMPSVSGRLLDADGAPEAGARVFYDKGGFETSGADGAFVVRPSDGNQRLRIHLQHGARGSARYAGPVTRLEDMSDVGSLVLPRIPSATIRVVDRTGAAVAGAHIGGLVLTDLLDPATGWDGVGLGLAPQLPIEEASYRGWATTDESGAATLDVPRQTDGRLIDLSVTASDGRFTSDHASTSDAELQPDGTFLVRMEGLPAPPQPAPAPELWKFGGVPDGGLLVTSVGRWRLGSDRPLQLRCSASGSVVVTCPHLADVTARVVGHGTGTIYVVGLDASGRQATWRTSVVVPSPISRPARLGRGWTIRSGGAAQAVDRGSRLELVRTAPAQWLHLLVRTRRGDGVIEIVGRNGSIRRVDLGRYAGGRRVDVRLPVGAGAALRVRVVSAGRPVVLRSYAFTGTAAPPRR